MKGFLETSMKLEVYRDFLVTQKCWVDGVLTHKFHRKQRQCPRCRRKWSCHNRLNRLDLIFAFSEGKTASAAAEVVGCSRNTAQVTFREMVDRVQ